MARCYRRLRCGGLVQRIGLVAVSTVTFLGLFTVAAPTASADDPVVSNGGYGSITTSIFVPGLPETRDVVARDAAGASISNPAVTCSYTLDTSNQASHSGDYPGLGDPGRTEGTEGSYYYRSCSNGAQGIVWVGKGQPAPGGPAYVVTPAQLAQEAVNRLQLPQPTVHRSPAETNDYEGSPFTWVNLWTWFWTDAASWAPQTQTTSVGPVSATVVARPVGLQFEPGGIGEDAVRCPGPGRAWGDADGNDAPSSGCGFRYTHVTDGVVTSRLGILWQVTWTGSGGTGGTLPMMQTVTKAPLQVLQAQVVNR